MCLELLVLSHGHHCISYVTNTFFGKMLESDLAVIAVEIHTVVCQGIAMGWQGMIGTAGIVARTLTGIVAQEYATGIHYPFSQLLIVGSGNDQMLRSIGVAKFDSLLVILDKDKFGIVVS